MTDSGIVELFFQRDETAIRETERKYGRYCAAVAARILDRKEDVEECVSDVWLAVWNMIPPKRPQLLKMFLAKITRHIAVDRYRKNAAQKRGGTAVEQSIEELKECLPVSGGMEEIVSENAMRESINAFIASLPEREGDIFIRRYFYVETVAEIAKRYKLKESNVLMILSRTRKKLEKHLIREGWIDDRRTVIQYG
ncbi:MAG: sigma-70 family RNA polymerase sigma factor [Lachnospiraceae bacterium]|nr:sigma-70 family RNA polymerase sigma factor [Lachnospiraceae bacterium]